MVHTTYLSTTTIVHSYKLLINDIKPVHSLILIIVLVMIFQYCIYIQINTEYERTVVFRLGRVISGGHQVPSELFLDTLLTKIHIYVFYKKNKNKMMLLILYLLLYLSLILNWMFYCYYDIGVQKMEFNIYYNS